MKGDYGKEQTLARGKTVAMGIDVHKENWHVTVLAAGEELFIRYPLSAIRPYPLYSISHALLSGGPRFESRAGSPVLCAACFLEPSRGLVPA